MTNSVLGVVSSNGTGGTSGGVTAAQLAAKADLSYVNTQLGSKANSASPSLTGTVTVSSATSVLLPSLSTVQFAGTTLGSTLDLKANSASPSLTGTVTVSSATSVLLPSLSTVQFAGTALSSTLDLKANNASPLFTGNVGIGTATARVALDIVSTSAILVPAGTAAQRPTGVKGYLRYNTFDDVFEGFSGTTGAWSPLAGAGGATAVITITGCTAASDGWIVQTDNTTGNLQVFTLNAFNGVEQSKVTPKFTGFTSIETNTDWPSTGWTVSSGTRVADGFSAWNAFDKITQSANAWISAQNEFDGTTGLPTGTDGGVWLRMDFPNTYMIKSYTIWCESLAAPLNWVLQGSNDGFSTFTAVQNYTQNSWTVGTTYSYTVDNTHIAFQNWRLFFTRKITATTETFISIGELSFTTKPKTTIDGSRKSIYSAVPINTSSFKLQVIENYTSLIDMTESPFAGPFNLMITKSNKVVNTGQYSFSAGGVTVVN